MAATAHKETVEVYHQFEDLEQQRECYVVGMWAFLVTEVMMFGAMFLAYMYYRMKHQAAFFEAHQQLNPLPGGINTFVLLISSFAMAMAVYFHQNRNKKMTLAALTAVQGCAATFMVIKLAWEWREKIEHHLVPWGDFYYSGKAASPEVAHLFFNLYFGMTGLHGVHILIGMLIIGVLQLMIFKNHPLVDDYIPTELVGLYWHFVDIVWIFLFPLFYLMPK